MESADRYLHKKFKKQLPLVESSSHNINVEKEEKTPTFSIPSCSDDLSVHDNYQSAVSHSERTAAAVTTQLVSTAVFLSDNQIKNSIDAVPNSSTNNRDSYSLSTSSSLVKSSISPANRFGALEANEKITSLVREDDNDKCKQAGELVDPQSLNSCISYVISKSSRLDNFTQREPQLRAVNFDTRFNVSEPIAISSADTSSILDNIYSKQYVTTKLVSIERGAGDISSCSGSLVNEQNSHEDSLSSVVKSAVESRLQDGSITELNITEKSSTGKYICSYCNLACSKPSVLQKHIRAHTNERPYPCVSCGFSFKTRSNLYKHCRSRTHANRVLGNKAQEVHGETDIESQMKLDYIEQNYSAESGNEDAKITDSAVIEERESCVEKVGQEHKMSGKPYKPRFHTAKAFFEDLQKDTEDQKVPESSAHGKPPDSTSLSLHISYVINKNNVVVNSNETPISIKKKSLEFSSLESKSSVETAQQYNDTAYPHLQINTDERNNDEPLNLTNKGRKRCISEVSTEPMTTSLIKELLLKNLYADSMQCQHCKMIFQTVTELELHKLRSCKAFIKSGARYSRSSSVNVASILTKNKNAFDTIQHSPNPVFALKSPGPFLGKTRLVECDKNKTFLFEDDNMQVNTQHQIDILRSTSKFSSPLNIQQERIKKSHSFKLFGGEVKVAQTPMEKNYKCDKYQDGLSEYGNRMSENRVVMSSLQSGGTVVHNKQSYIGKSDNLRSSPDILRMYENSSISPNIDIISLERSKFSFDQLQNQLENDIKSSEQNVGSSADVNHFSFNDKINASHKYTNVVDLCQKTVQQFAPNLKQPTLSIVSLPISINNKLSMSRLCSAPCDSKASPIMVSQTSTEYSRAPVINFSCISKTQDLDNRHSEYSHKPYHTQHFMSRESSISPSLRNQNVCNPLNILINGKVVRYVPGIPGPVTADIAVDTAYGENNMDVQPSFNTHIQQRSQKSTVREHFMETPGIKSETGNQIVTEKPSDNRTSVYNGTNLLKIDKKRSEYRGEQDIIRQSPKLSNLEINVNEPTTLKLELKSPNVKLIEKKSPLSKSENKSPNTLSVPTSNLSEISATRKFTRPNTLALKPSSAAYKQHHGLTPTVFNQILISPDTPRVAKKYIQHFLHGNYFSYLGLKSSTKTVYCTLNKTQPFYVQFYMKLSMYSEWRQQESKGEKLYASCYDSRQRQQKYVMAGKASSDLIVHSSYKFINNNNLNKTEEQNKLSSILGGYESNEDYTYVRGRGRGKYVCDQCGIRCKKPSMLKKHIRTHTNDRPYTCSHCNFSFKTKGNLTKHLKSKAHTKNYAASSSSSSSTQQSGTQSSESDTDDSGMDSSDESTRQQEHEAAYGLLSLSQKTTPSTVCNSSTLDSPAPYPIGLNSLDNSVSFMNTEQVTHVNNSNFAKNKILDQGTINFNAVKILNEISNPEPISKDTPDLSQFLGKSSTTRPLTYPYTSDIIDVTIKPVNASQSSTGQNSNISSQDNEPKKFIISDGDSKTQNLSPPLTSEKNVETNTNFETANYDHNFIDKRRFDEKLTPPVMYLRDKIIGNVDDRKHRNLKNTDIEVVPAKKSKIYFESEAIDLSMPSLVQKCISPEQHISTRLNGKSTALQPANRSHINAFSPIENINNDSNYGVICKDDTNAHHKITNEDYYKHNGAIVSSQVSELPNLEKSENVINSKTTSKIIINYGYQENNPLVITNFNEVPNNFYDNSAMETLADVATKQVKLEKNTMAKSVASEYLKLATKQELQANEGVRESSTFVASPKDVNELIVKPEENKSCNICSKTFIKPSQLRLHMNIHYLERPFRCDPCSVSFRTKGHLQKHERSASHHNKLSSSPLLSSSEPRPFKCSDCNIAFRIHGHLAKHLRSKMHIMKLECLAKIPFGLYAELERANSLLTEINTTDGDQCLESLKILARKIFINDPSKLNQLAVSVNNADTSDS